MVIWSAIKWYISCFWNVSDFIHTSGHAFWVVNVINNGEFFCILDKFSDSSPKIVIIECMGKITVVSDLGARYQDNQK